MAADGHGIIKLGLNLRLLKKVRVHPCLTKKTPRLTKNETAPNKMTEGNDDR